MPALELFAALLLLTASSLVIAFVIEVDQARPPRPKAASRPRRLRREEVSELKRAA